jgi:hypothetical protein
MMKKIRLWMLAAILTCSLASVYGQRIQVVDQKGNGIALVSVTTTDGNLIGTTDIEGVLSNVKGHQKVGLSHLAYQPKMVTVSELKDSKVTLLDLDYNIAEIVVKPKQYIYVETYYRVYLFIGDSLAYYRAGILANGYDPKKKEVDLGGIWAYGSFCDKGRTWKNAITSRYAEKGGGIDKESALGFLSNSDKAKNYYAVTLKDLGDGRLRVSNPEGTVGYITNANGVSNVTLDGGKMQLYANKTHGEDKMLKRRENSNYEYQYTEMFRIGDDGNVAPEDLIMKVNHWEYDHKGEHHKTILETYATGRDYMDKKEFKAKKKELNGNYAGDMPFSVLEAYEQSHNIPPLAPTIAKRVTEMRKGKK